jgi:signal transduction histidine kinase
MTNDLHESATEPDAAAQRGIEDRLAAEYLRLVELTQAKDHFLTAVSHELRTPLTSILSSTELLQVLADLDGAPAELVGIVDRNVARMLQLIDGLSLLARLESGQLTLDLQLVDLAEAVTEAVQRRRSGADATNLGIELAAIPGPPTTADPLRLGQVLDHLLGNATRYTPAGGRVTVRAEAGDAGWVVTIQDTGIGIPAAEQEGVFAEFARGSNARQAGINGTGIGLAISRRIAELHGGQVTLTSVEGEGTTVTLRLPYAYADPRLRD